MESKIEVKGLRNARDVANVRLKNGKIKPDILIRSSKLDKISKKRLDAFIAKYNITTIIDLRTSVEIREGRLPVYPEGVNYHHIQLLNQDFLGITHEKKMAWVMLHNRHRLSKKYSGDDYMIEMYKSIVLDEKSHLRLRDFFDILLNQHEGAVLYHCTGGKDRTGIATMFILSLLGAEEEDILNDYALSDIYNAKYIKSRKMAINFVIPFSKKFRPLLLSLLYAKRVYLEETIKAIKEKYQSIDHYLKECIGITPEMKDKFRKMYLE